MVYVLSSTSINKPSSMTQKSVTKGRHGTEVLPYTLVHCVPKQPPRWTIFKAPTACCRANTKASPPSMIVLSEQLKWSGSTWNKSIRSGKLFLIKVSEDGTGAKQPEQAPHLAAFNQTNPAAPQRHPFRRQGSRPAVSERGNKAIRTWNSEWTLNRLVMQSILRD